MEEKHGNERKNDPSEVIDLDPHSTSDQGVTSEEGVPFIKDGGNALPAAKGKAIIGALLYNKYRIVSLIAKGGMGEVYKARLEPTDQFVAVKVLSERFLEKKENVYRFMREISSVAVLKHHNVVNVIDMGLLANGCPYYVMEYVEGKSLAEILAESNRLEVERVKRIATQLASALATAHSLGFIHRDIKPSNIIVTKGDFDEEVIKLVDFGIALRTSTDDKQKLTAKGTVIGSPLYMSPEQCEGKDTDARSDVYSACCTLYECITGKPPFRGETPLLTMAMHKNDSPRPLDLKCDEGENIAAVILKGMRKEPDERFQNAQEMLDLLVTGVLAKTSSSEALDAYDKTLVTPSVGIPAIKTQHVTADLVLENEEPQSDEKPLVVSENVQPFWMTPIGFLTVIAFTTLVIYLVLKSLGNNTF